MHKIFLHFICCQGRPTEAMAETEPLVYGGQVAKDFIPGAEILPEEAEPKEEKEKNGEEREKEKEKERYCNCT